MPTGDPFKKVRPGDKLRIPSVAYNAFIDAAMDLRARRQNATSQDTPTFRQSGIITVKNCTGENRERFDVLGVDDPIFTPDQNEQSFKNRVMFDGVTPVDPDHKGKFVVLLEPLKPNSLGMACIDGVCPAWVTLPDDNGSGGGGSGGGSQSGGEPPKYADIQDGDATALLAGDAGGAQILWIDPNLAPGDSGWAIVRLGAGTGTPLKWGKATENWSPPDENTGEGGNVVTVNPCDPDGGNVDTGTEVEVYLVSPHDDTGGKPLDYAEVAYGDVIAYFEFREADQDKGVALNTVVGGTFENPEDLREHPDLFDQEEQVLWDRQDQGGSDGVKVCMAVGIHPHHKTLAAGDIDKWHTLCGTLEIDSAGHIRRIKWNAEYDYFNVSDQDPKPVSFDQADVTPGKELEAARWDHVHKVDLTCDELWITFDHAAKKLKHIGPQPAIDLPDIIDAEIIGSEGAKQLRIWSKELGFDARGHYTWEGNWNPHVVDLPSGKDERVKADGNDPVPGFLNDKLIADEIWLHKSVAGGQVKIEHIGPDWGQMWDMVDGWVVGPALFRIATTDLEVDDKGHVTPWDGWDIDLGADNQWIAWQGAGTLAHIGPQWAVDFRDLIDAEIVNGAFGKVLRIWSEEVTFDAKGHYTWEGQWNNHDVDLPDEKVAADWMDLHPGYLTDKLIVDETWLHKTVVGGQVKIEHWGPDGTTAVEAKYVRGLDMQDKTLIFPTAAIDFDYYGHEIEVWDETQGFPQVEFIDDDWIEIQPCGFGGNYQLQFQHIGPCAEASTIDPIDSIAVTPDSLLIKSKILSIDACGHVRTPSTATQEHELLLQRLSVVVDFRIAGNAIQVKRQNIYVPVSDPPGDWETIHTGTDCPST